MYTIFGKVFAQDKAGYIKAKLTAASIAFPGRTDAASSDEINNAAEKMLSKMGTAEVPIFLYNSMKDHATAEQIAKIKLRMRCANQTLAKNSPLLDGETIQDDFFTYLTGPYFDIPAGSAVLRRTTNMAELYYVFEELEVSDGNVSFKKADVQHKALVCNDSNSMIVNLFEKLAEGLLGTFGGKAGEIGASVLGSVFDQVVGDQVPSYFDQVYKEISQIVQQIVDQNTIDQVNGIINGLQQWIRSSYIPRKNQSGITKQELFDMLSQPVLDFYKAIGILQQSSFSNASLPVFLAAASTHLSLLQEQALVDPHTSDPTQSSYASSVQIQAQLYSSYAVNTYNNVISARTSPSVIYVRQVTHDVKNGQYSWTQTGHAWYDAFTNQFGSFYMDGDKNDDGTTSATKEMQGHIAYVANQLTCDLGYPLNIAQSWQTLVKTPIPGN